MDSPGKNTGVGCQALLQAIFPIQGLNPRLLCIPHFQVGSLPLVLPGKPNPGEGSGEEQILLSSCLALDVLNELSLATLTAYMRDIIISFFSGWGTETQMLRAQGHRAQ